MILGGIENHAYSPIRHLALSVWLNHDPEGRHLAMYTAYYDASGVQRELDGVLLVAGVLASVDRWLEFESAWGKVLADNHVSHLHMKHFAHSTDEFTSWKGDEARRAKFLGALIEVLSSTLEVGFVVRMRPADFHAVNRRYELARWNSATRTRSSHSAAQEGLSGG